MANELTEAEKRTVASILRPRSDGWERALAYGAYVLPSVLFAAYGVWNQDFAAVLVAYVTLLVVVLLYLGWVRDASARLRSALEKYEAMTGASRQR
ncbi:hypothetical protein [Dokdonella sp.]|uniref:hypothetical protein n=1 Tax=Dokdonella sp. TaxID=2291710 RepID=UPI003529AF03